MGEPAQENDRGSPVAGDLRAITLLVAAILGGAAVERDPILAVLGVALFGGDALARARGASEAVRRAIAALAVAIFTVLEVALAFGEREGALPPRFVLLPLAGIAGALTGGLAVGNAVLVVALAGVCAYAVGFPIGAPAEGALRFNLLGALGATLFFLGGYGLFFRRLSSKLEQQRTEIEARLAERTRLIRALEEDLDTALRRISAELGRAEASIDALAAAHRGLTAALEDARATLTKRPPSEASEPALALGERFHLTMSRWLVVVSMLQLSAVLVRIHLMGSGATLSVYVALGVHVVALGLLFARPAWRVHAITFFFLAMFGLIAFASFGYWGASPPPPNLVFVPTLTFHAVLIGGPRIDVGAIVTGLLLAFLGAIAWLGMPIGDWGVRYLSSVVVWTIVATVGWLLLEGRLRAYLVAITGRTAELGRLDRFRARVSGTLFHDVANPVQALGITMELAQRGGRVDVGHRELLGRLAERLEALVVATSRVLEDGSSAPVTVPVGIEDTFEALREVFAHRLERKALTLSLEAEPELRAIAEPALFRDCVLANFVSNAIKFSPRGARVEVSARKRGDAVEVVVRDHGAGWPKDLAQKLEAGERVRSTNGTDGEEGLGLGLTLAKEHLARMGGSLELRPADGGGALAIVALRAA